MKSLIDKYHQDLLENIPISQHLGVQIRELSEESVTLSAPLKENINYAGTAFGGSLNAVAVLSCYLMLHHLLKSNHLSFSSVVIQGSEIKYLQPTTQDFLCSCHRPTKEIIDAFFNSLEKKGRARIQLKSEVVLDPNETPRVVFLGNFVAKK